MKRATAVLLVAPLVVGACLDPRVSDEVEPQGTILPAGSPVPSLDDDPVLGPRVRDLDGFEGTIPLLTGFRGGKLVHWWNLGPAPEFAAPLYVLARRGDDGELHPIGHPAIVGRVPGDDGYTPFWALTFVEVNRFYGNQVITSVNAMQRARELGILEKPAPQFLTVNCPVVGPDVLLQMPGGQAVAPPGRFYYEGREGRYLEFGPTELGDDGVHVPSAPLYVLRREGGEPLSEPVRGVDMTGDGDLLDTNDIFTADPTPRLSLTEITLAPATRSIDSNGDENESDVTGVNDLFSGATPAAGVIAVHVTETFLNAPVAGEATP